MLNKGQIHKEIGEFLRYSSNSIILDENLSEKLVTLENLEIRLQDEFTKSKIARFG